MMASTPAPEVVELMSRTWQREPVCHAQGTGRTDLASALWRHTDEDEPEVHGDPVADKLTIVATMTSAKVDVWHNDKMIHNSRFPAGALSILSPNTSVRACMYESLSVAHIYLPTAHINDVIDHAGLPINGIELIDPIYQVDALSHRVVLDLLQDIRNQKALTKLRFDVLAQDLAIHLVRRYSNLSNQFERRIRPRGGLATWQVRRATDYLIDHLAEDVRLATVADLVGLSHCHFARAFKASTGYAPHCFQVAARLERAQSLLLTTDLPIIDIAAQVGYDDPNQLARMFRKWIGRSPREYRRICRM